jgi:four helix bundle protein
MSNIAEGFERGGRGEFHQFLSTAKASCAEVRTELYVALDVGFIDQVTFGKIIAVAEKVGRIIDGLQVKVYKHRTI